MKSLVVIPSRYKSTRFPGKPLADINGKPMVQLVWESCINSDADEVVVATDSKEIYDKVSEFGKAVMTSERHSSGTERVAEASKLFPEYDIIINVQGDEPFINHEDINELIRSVKSNHNGVSTFVTYLSEEEGLDRNVVKCLAKYNRAMMFTRSPIYNQLKSVYKHIGIYGFRKSTLETISHLKDKTKNEIAENLEQLRWLDNNIEISVTFTPNSSIGIDTPEDLEKALKLI